jgi:hypothetical protein
MVKFGMKNQTNYNLEWMVTSASLDSLTARLASNERWIHIATTATNSQQPIPGSGA